MKVAKEIGWNRVVRFGVFSLVNAFYQMLLFPPLRTIFLRLMRAKVGKNVVLHKVRFFNLYRKGWSGLKIGHNCFMGDECLIDLAEAVLLEDAVTFAERVTVLTHMNVGYQDHPLQKFFPSMAAPVVCRKGSFVGTGAILLPGVEIGECSVVAAGAVVRENVSAFSVVGGVPAKVLKVLSANEACR